MNDGRGSIEPSQGRIDTPVTLQWIWIFTVATALLSAVFDYPIFGKAPLSDAAWGLLVVCWVPGALGLLSLIPISIRRVMRQSLTWPSVRFFMWAILFPLGYATLAYGGALLLGGCGFDWGRPFSWGLLGWPLLGRLLRSTGEELGWRGFLFPALRNRMTFGMASMVSGFIWAAWHYPAIALGNYNNGGILWFSLVSFTLMVMGMTVVISWLREVSGSVWPCALFHAVNNFYIQQVLDPRVVPNRITPFVTSEWGVALAMGCLIAGAVVYRFYRNQGFATEAR